MPAKHTEDIVKIKILV